MTKSEKKKIEAEEDSRSQSKNKKISKKQVKKEFLNKM